MSSGTQVTMTTSDGTTISGEVLGIRDDGLIIVRWSDGMVTVALPAVLIAG